MDQASFASLLFFTRAAVMRDPALANARLGEPFADWGGVSINRGKAGAGKSGQPLSLAALFRAWDNQEVLRICPDCLASMLFLHGGCNGGGMFHRRYQIAWHCPFCEKTHWREIWGMSEGEAVVDPIHAVFRHIQSKTKDIPPGLPFAEALARLRALRDADLLNPSHPLAAESIAQNPLARHALESRWPSWLQARRRRRRLEAAVRDARIRAELITPERLAAARARLNEVSARQAELRAVAATELDETRYNPGNPGPKVRFWRCEITDADYRAIKARKRELKASLRPKRIAADRVAAIVGPLEQELGRPLSADERRVFCAAVEQ